MTPNHRVTQLIALEGIVLPLLVVWLGEWLVGMNSPELVPKLYRTVFAALPFAVLYVSARAIIKTGGSTVEAELLGAVALVTSGFLLLWGWWLVDAARPARGGANIGLGIILMFSPLLLALLILPGRWLGRALTRHASSKSA